MSRYWKTVVATVLMACLGVVVGCSHGEIFGVVTGGLLGIKLITDRSEDQAYDDLETQVGKQYNLAGYVYVPAAAAKAGQVQPLTTVNDTLVGEGYTPLAGATVTMDGTSVKTVTNSSGAFILYEPPSGFNTFTVKKGATLIRFSTDIAITGNNGVIVKKNNTGVVETVTGVGLSDDVFTSGQAIGEVLDSFYQSLEAEPAGEDAAVTTIMTLVSPSFSSQTFGSNSDEFRNYLQNFFLTYNDAEITLNQEQLYVSGSTARWTALRRLEATVVATGTDTLQDSHVELTLTQTSGNWKLSKMELLPATEHLLKQMQYSYTFEVQGPFNGSVVVGIPIDRTNQDVSDISFSPIDGEILTDSMHGNQAAVWNKNIQEYENITFTVSFNLKNVDTLLGGKPSGVGTVYDQTSAIYYLYTRSTDLCQSSNDLIIAATRNAVGSETGPYEQAEAVYDYVLDRLTFDQSSNFSDALSALSSSTQSSSGYATLTVALMRAAGIPARLLYGLVDLGEGTFSLAGQTGSFYTLKPHIWVEFYLPGTGWVECDPVFEDIYLTDFFGFSSRSRIIFSVGEENSFSGTSLPDRGLQTDVLSQPLTNPANVESTVRLTIAF
ncbi:MAG: transglutaminase domain-containing protein [bacterium]|jgi:hypothetical protein|nr:transglutaminase domain-containing protein [bacterium]